MTVTAPRGAPTVHATIVDCRDRRLRGTAIIVGAPLACLLLTGSLWSAATHFPGQPGSVLVQVLANTAGPPAVLTVHTGPGSSR